MNTKFLYLLLAVSIFGCSHSFDVGIKRHIITNSEGDSLVFYIGHKENADPNNKLLVMIQGSGRESIQRRFGWGVEGAAYDFDILYMEKYAFDDSLKFLQSDCRERRVNDIETTLHYVIDSSYHNRLNEILIFSDSEGGAISPEIANEIPEVKRMIIISNGGLNGPEKIKLAFEKEKRSNKKGYFFLSGIDTIEKLDKLLDDIKNNPTVNKTFLGSTYKYWDSYIFYDVDNDFNKLKIPTLVLVGENDSSIPVESVLSLKEKKKENISAYIIPDADHEFKDKDGNKKFSEVYKNIIIPWVKETEPK